MPRFLVLVCAVLAACSSAANARSRCSGPDAAAPEAQPIAVLLQHSPWTGGTESPLFILYEDGRVIYPVLSQGKHPVAYRQACLGGTPDSLRARFGVGPELRGLNERYDYRPNWSDQESVFLYAWTGDSLTRVMVRAGRESQDRLSPAVPAAFRNAFQRITEFRAENAEPWLPDTLEVAAWPYEYAPDNPPAQWPEKWPDLTSPGTRHETDELVDEIHFIYLDGGELQRLQAFLSRVRERQAVAINGRKWAVGYRMVFPGEWRWKPLLGDLEM